MGDLGPKAGDLQDRRVAEGPAGVACTAQLHGHSHLQLAAVALGLHVLDGDRRLGAAAQLRVPGEGLVASIAHAQRQLLVRALAVYPQANLVSRLLVAIRPDAERYGGPLPGWRGALRVACDRPPHGVRLAHGDGRVTHVVQAETETFVRGPSERSGVSVASRNHHGEVGTVL